MRRLAAVGMAMVLALALTACEPEDGVTPAATKGQKVTVPDVVGQRLSDAGAAMLKVGLTHVEIHDATDQHRAVLNGNKWVVVKPAAEGWRRGDRQCQGDAGRQKALGGEVVRRRCPGRAGLETHRPRWTFASGLTTVKENQASKPSVPWQLAC